jgi:hypothetical protein
MNITSPLPAPEKSDWLAEHKEPGQSVNDYSRKRSLIKNLHKKFIYLVPLEQMPTENFVDVISEYCRSFFLGMEVKILQGISVETLKIKHRMN